MRFGQTRQHEEKTLFGGAQRLYSKHGNFWEVNAFALGDVTLSVDKSPQLCYGMA